MARVSGGLLVYRRSGQDVEVLLVHPGGPFWAKKDTWSIPKGECEDGEDILAAARREFREEVGVDAPDGESVPLGLAKSGDKVNHIWAVEGDVDLSNFRSNLFEMEWPPKSGQMQEFPENDRVAWWPVAIAKQKVFKNQQPFFDRFTEAVHIELAGPPEQQSLL